MKGPASLVPRPQLKPWHEYAAAHTPTPIRNPATGDEGGAPPSSLACGHHGTASRLNELGAVIVDMRQTVEP